MADRPPEVEFLWWAECPSWERALAILAQEMAAHGLDPDSVAMTEITDDEQAERLGFPGSPTIRVNGRDVQDPGGLPTGLTCRIYRLRDGRMSPLPDRADLSDALVNALEGDG